MTKRSRPARSLLLRVSRQPDSSGNTQYTAAPCCAPCSTATRPPGRSSRRAVRSTARMAFSPSAPLHSAAGGSYSPTSGGTDAPTGMYGGLLITRSTVPSSSPSTSLKSPACSMTRPAVYGALSTYLVMLRSAQARASGSASTACTRARGTSCPMASAMAPDPVPRSATTGSATSISPEPVDGPAGHHLGLRPGHEHARPHLELEVAEVRLAGDVLQRLAGGPAGDIGPEPRVEGGVGHGVQLAAPDPVHAGRDQLGVGARRFHPGLGQPRRGQRHLVKQQAHHRQAPRTSRTPDPASRPGPRRPARRSPRRVRRR